MPCSKTLSALLSKTPSLPPLPRVSHAITTTTSFIGAVLEQRQQSCHLNQRGKWPSARYAFPVCGSGFAEWAPPQAEAALFGADLSEVHQCSIVRTADVRYRLFELTCLARAEEVSFCDCVTHKATRLLADVLRFLNGIGPISRVSEDKPHPSVMFETKRLQTVS